MLRYRAGDMASRLGMDDSERSQTANELLQVNVKELMRWRKLTQAQLALSLNVSQPWLSKRLTGTTPFQIEDVDAIAHAFGLSPAQLLCEGVGAYDRRKASERRSGEERRLARPIVPRES